MAGLAFLSSGRDGFPAGRDGRARRLRLWLAGLLVLSGVISVQFGASGVSLFHVLSDLARGAPLELRDRVVLLDIRLPRLALSLLVGAALAVSGAVLQGLFRNPLADPGIVGVGAGAGLGAVLAIVLGGSLPAAFLSLAGGWVGAQLVGLAAFTGSSLTVFLLYRVATRGGRTSVATMLLAGIALAALAGAVTGLLIFGADDKQLRDLTFWGLGSLAGATWTKVLACLPLMLPALLLAPLMAAGLNALALGEPAAHQIGFSVQRIKLGAILSVAAATGSAVAVSGGIGFVGIVVPHLLRLACGPDHRQLLPNAALAGAALLTLADSLARLLVAPAELPIGILTALIGAPVFLWILLRDRGVAEL